MHHFCTIATPDYLPFVQTLFASLKEQGDSCKLHALVLTKENLPFIDGIKWYTPNDFENNDDVKNLFQKYQHNSNNIRWALKPFFLLHLLQQEEAVIYLDNDLYFFNRYEFLFDELQKHSLLLTPHWSCFEPQPSEENFLTSFQLGLFNAGFVGATKRAKKTLEWWARLCLYKTEDNPSKGFFVDQRYLDLALIYDPAIGIVQHRGCNVSSVNMQENRRIKMNGKVLINGEYPIIFIHFNAETVTHILNQNDEALKPYYDEYAAVFENTGYRLSDFKHQTKSAPLVIQFKRKIKLRTRLKQVIFHLYKRL
jgi:lipopolysaccharide biosynthesis glycosyltransferase